MDVPAVSSRQGVSRGYASSKGPMDSDQQPNILKSAAMRRFFFALLLLLPFMPAPANAATACDTAAGEFQFPLIDGDCYRCPAGYEHDILFAPSEVGVCTRIEDETTAIRRGDSQFLCPVGQFPNLPTGTCNSCPSGSTVNLDGTCTEAPIAADFDGPFRTCTGTIDGRPVFDGLNDSCYTCPSGYDHTPLPVDIPGVCTRTTTQNSAMTQCGTRTESCTTNPMGFCPLISAEACDLLNAWIAITTCSFAYNSTRDECARDPVPVGVELVGNTFYSCPDGFETNVIGTFNDPQKCVKNTPSNLTATREFSVGCNAHAFDGLNQNCYTCPSTHTPSVFPAAPPRCTIKNPVAQTEHGAISFLCPEGQFLDLATNECYTCPEGYDQDEALSAATAGVCFEKLDTLADLVPPKLAGLPCLGLFQGNCADGLVCEGTTKTCRHDPPQAGEACGLLVPCSTLPLDTNPNDDRAAQNSLTCLSGRCGVKGGPGSICDSAVTNSCADDLVCVLGECQHERPLRGERCDQAFSPCATEHPHEFIPNTTQPLPLDLACHSGHISQEFRCDTPRKIGQTCGGLGQGSCEDGLLCALSYDNQGLTEINLDTFDPARVGLRCTPGLNFGGAITEDACRLFYDPELARSVNEAPVFGIARVTRTIGIAASLGVGASLSIESGVVYGPSNTAHPNGEYGCYATTCTGVESSAGLESSACIGYETSFPIDESVTAQAFVKVDLVGLGSLNPIPVGGGMTVSTSFSQGLSGVNSCVFGGVGKGLSISPGVQTCTTRITKLDTSDPSNLPGIPSNTGSAISNPCLEAVIVRPNTGQLQLTWPPVAGAQTYRILRNAEGIDAVYATLVTDHVTSYATYLDEGLENGTAYWYHVVPQDSQGNRICTTEATNGTPVARTRTR